MYAHSIKGHLKAYRVAGRSSTFNHALASALAPFDKYDRATANEAVSLLGQNPDAELDCSYCGHPAATWDHIRSITKKSAFSGYGHRLGNLLPCCRTCNEKKGGRDWLEFLQAKVPDPEMLAERRGLIEQCIARYDIRDETPHASKAYDDYQELRAGVIRMLNEADRLAAVIRDEMATARLNRADNAG